MDKIKEKKNSLSMYLNNKINLLYENLNQNEKEILENIKITFNLLIIKELKGNKEEIKVKIQILDGLPNIIVDNFDVFQNILLIYGFIPILNNIIYIEGNKKINIGKIIGFNTLIEIFELFLKIGDQFPYPIYSEVSKFIDLLEKNKEINHIINHITFHLIFEKIGKNLEVINNLKKLNGTKINRIKQLPNIIGEIIFLETAIREENTLRIRFPNIKSTYLYPAFFEQDNKKIDLIQIYNYKNNVFKNYIQLYNPFNYNKEKVNIKSENTFEKAIQFKNEYDNFLFITILSNANPGNNEIKKIFMNRVYNKDIRIKTSIDGKFPLFINNLEKSDIINYILIYYLIHIINYKKIKNYLNNLKIVKGKIQNKKEGENNIKGLLGNSISEINKMLDLKINFDVNLKAKFGYLITEINLYNNKDLIGNIQIL